MMIGKYFLAEVYGFPGINTMRVKVIRMDSLANVIWVKTADLKDSGTALILAQNKLLEEVSCLIQF